MITVRIAHAEPRPGRLVNGEFQTRGHLVVLADDAGRRAVPVWLRGEPGESELAALLEHKPQPVPSGVPQELAVRLLRAVRAQVTGVDVDLTEAGAGELTPEVTVTRIGLAGWPAGTLFARRPRYEPRNLDFASDLDRWDLDAEPDYTARIETTQADTTQAEAGEGPAAVLSAAVPRPAGSAALLQTVYADDYRGATVTFSGEIRVDPLTEQAGLRLEIFPHWWRVGRPREDHGLTVSGGRRWTRYEVTARIPADADLLRFGIALTGTGRIALRNPELHRFGPTATPPEPTATPPEPTVTP